VDVRDREYRPLTVAEVAGHVAKAGDESTRRRILLEFLEGWTWADRATRPVLVAEEPVPTGDERWDVLLAGIAEHVCALDGRAGPRWVEGRVLDRFWFPDDTPAARAWAYVHAPAALRHRGVFIAAEDLVRV
jgi:hypothetical protein